MFSIDKLKTAFLNSTTLTNQLQLEVTDQSISINIINSNQIDVIGTTANNFTISSTTFAANIPGWQLLFNTNQLIFKNIFANSETIFEGSVTDTYTPEQNMTEIGLGNGDWKIFAGDKLVFTWNNYKEIEFLPGTADVSVTTKPVGIDLGDKWVLSYDTQHIIIYYFDVTWNEIIKFS